MVFGAFISKKEELVRVSQKGEPVRSNRAPEQAWK